MPRVPTGAPFEERGGRLRGALDLIAGRYPRFVFGGRVGDILPVFHFHEAAVASLEPAFAYLAENEYRTVVSDDVAAFVRGGPHPGARSIVLAFDDAWASLWLVVGPLLRKYGLRAVTYAIPARIAEAASVRPTLDDGPVDALTADRAEHPFVTWPELKALSTSGLVDVQSHTWSHSMIFSGDVVIGRVSADLTGEPMLNRPRIDDGSTLEFVTPDRVGFPLFQRRSRMSDALRFFPEPEACARLEVSAGDEADILPFAGKIRGRWETADEQSRAIERELAASRETLQSRLAKAVRHICLPWGVSGTITRRALERTGFHSAFANKLSGRFAVGSGNDPYYLKRLNERHLFALPGRGRVSKGTGVEPTPVPLAGVATTPVPLDPVETTPVPFPDDVEIAVVSHNGRETLPRLLDCVRAAGAPDDRITIYDIGSTDETAEWLARDSPRVIVRRLNDNVGPNPGRNWAIRAATRPFVLLLDADAFIHADAPAHLRRALDPAAGVGAVASVIVHAHDPNQVQYAGGGLHFICEAVSPYVDRPLTDRGSSRLDIGAAPGMALLIDVSAAQQCGLFDERYFLGKDDGDFCHRLRMSGYRLVEEPKAVCEHRSRPRSAWLFPFQIRNRWHFMLKNYETRTLLVLAPALLVHEVLQFGMLVAKGHLVDWWKALHGLRAWMPSLAEERRVIQGRRKIRDRDLLTDAPLIVRQDMVGGGGGHVLKRAYDAWLRGYWSLATLLLS